MENLCAKESRDSFQVVCARLEKALAEHHYAVISVTDLKPRLLSKGVVLPYSSRLYEVCQAHPTKALLDQDRALASVLPWRIVVHEAGRGVRICSVLPTRLWPLFQVEALASLAPAFERDLQAVMAAAAG